MEQQTGSGKNGSDLVPKGYIFGSAINKERSVLVGCMVSPGFDFKDFELFDRAYLLD
ncbi:cupin domain-containing protein [Lacrimispora sp. JR3]|uniref:cupin domain-containing protein n=1 Tax=Lacrimispora sinapis TaxID=3111456 RepID=UPI003748A2F3